MRKTVPGRDLRGFLIHNVQPSLEKSGVRKKCE